MSAAVILWVVEGESDRPAHVFVDPGEIALGRAPDAAVRVPDADRYKHVSRRHCRLVIAPPAAVAIDEGGQYGTHVNGKRLPAHGSGCPLADGDELRLGAENPGGGVVFRISLVRDAACCGCGRPLDRDDVLGACAVPAGLLCASCTTPTPAAVSPGGAAVCPGCLTPAHGVCPGCRKNHRALAERLVGEEPALADRTLADLLGAGGAGAVYLLTGTATAPPVALKLILDATTPYERAACAREVRYTAQLGHPNLIRFGAAGCWRGVVYFTMDHCPGGSLRDRLERQRGPLGTREAVGITVQVLDALAYLHSLPVADPPPTGARGPAVGLVHRDIKPGNVLLSDDSPAATARVSDLGLAKAFQHAGHSGITGPAQNPRGTPKYMSRWQLDRYLWAGPEVDVWATAATLYFALTRQTPRTFDSERVADVIRNTLPVPIAERRAKLALPALPPGLSALIDDALRDDLPPRYSAETLRDALRPYR